MHASSEQPSPNSPARPEEAAPVEGAQTQQMRERNRILRALPPGEYSLIRPHLELCSIDALQVLVNSGEPLRHVYFPETAIVSEARYVEEGRLVEAGTIGCEGMGGLAAILGESWSPAVLQGQVPGECKRMGASVLREMLPELKALDSTLRRFTLAFLDQLGQSAACNAAHSVVQRCARWLLMAHDRVGSDEFVLTHRVLSQMLGVRRASVSEVAGTLQERGVIHYERGRVSILQRAGLQAAACECYRITRSHFDRLLGPGSRS